jgi:hypothetical protein
MELRTELVTRVIRDPRAGFEPTTSRVETRWDPLTGQTARVLLDVDPLLPAADLDLALDDWLPPGNEAPRRP